MNVLDENFPPRQRECLRRRRVPARKVGADLGYRGMQDEEVVRLLLSLRRATFFTLDVDFSRPRLCHPGYCLVYLEVHRREAAAFVRRVLRHPRLNTQAKRMGSVIHASPAGLRVWRRHTEEETLAWA